LPVTARLSQRFYERFGDEIASEFVDWFNAVDATYQQQLRELNDLNWLRFKAEMDARFAQSEARLSEKFSDKLAETKSDISYKVSETESRLMKWMFIYWSGTVLSLGGLMVAVLAVVLRR
jgi:hypothetical protein